MPDRVEAQLKLLKTMRKNQVKSFALRALGEVYDADSVRSLAKLIDTALDDSK
ncbi:UNVERIFIED_ORG: hypothetical protein ABIB19_003215 [Arthrobacter sp. UYEF10]